MNNKEEKQGTKSKGNAKEITKKAKETQRK